jgi:HEAT repeat protein
MKKLTILLILAFVGASYAAIPELVEQLGSTNLAVQTEARARLFAECSHAGRPGAEAERKAVCQAICAVLKPDSPPAVASELVRNLQRIGAEESVRTLVSLMGSPDAHLRDDARQALEVNPSPAAGQALLSELEKARDPHWTAGLITALGERGGQGTSSVIAAYLNSTDPLIFMAAVKALGRLAEPEGIKAMVRQRGGENGVRKAALDAALFETRHKAVFEKLYAGSEPDEVRAVALLGWVMNNGTRVAADAMASGHAGFQSAVIEAASQRGDTALYNVVASRMDTLPPPLQVQAMGVLEFSGNRSYARVIEPLLEADDVSLQDAAAQALACIGTAESIQALLSSGTAESRKALGILHAHAADRILEQEAAGAGENTRRAVSINALARRGRRDLRTQFFSYAAEEDKAVSESAVAALGMIGDLSNLQPLAELMLARETEPLSRTILEAIVEVMRRSTRPDEAVSILLAQREGASVRGEALILQALAQVGTREALAPVVQACTSSDEKLQKQAVKLLGGWTSDNALPAMLDLAGGDTFSLANHVVLMRGVSRLLAGQKKLDEPVALLALETCRRADEKKMIIATLAKARSPEAKTALQACLLDPELKAEAEAALNKTAKNGKNKGKKRKKS